MRDQLHLGERKLTSIHAIGQSLAIGPIFSAGLLTGLIASAAGLQAHAGRVERDNPKHSDAY